MGPRNPWVFPFILITLEKPCWFPKTGRMAALKITAGVELWDIEKK
jgi:hypothetical protein